MTLQNLLEELFTINQINHTKRSLAKIKQFGGFDNLLKQILEYDPHTITHRKRFGRQFLLESFLMYLVTLSLLSKLLLFTHNVISHFNILSESIGVVFLVVIILMKKRRVKSQRAMRREIPKNRLNSKQYKIHRGDQQLTIDQSGIKPGDILKMSPQQELAFDGIVIEVEKSTDQHRYHDSLAGSIVISEKGQETKQHQCCKHSIRQAQLCDDLDPFLFRGSVIQEGSAWVLVCIVGSRQRDEHYNEAFEQRWMGLSRASQVTQVLKAAISFPILGLGVEWLSQVEGGYFESYLQLLKVVSSLLLYLSYVNENQMLWLIGRYFVEQQQGQNYKITNPKLMQSLGRTDIIVIEDGHYSKKLECLSQLATVHDIKIVTTKEPSAIQKDFAFQITPHSIYQDVQTHSLSHRLDLLIQAKFISCDFPYFCQYYLALLQEMGFKVLLIGCQQKQKKNNKNPSRIDESIKVRDQTRMLQVVVDLHRKSSMMKRMRDCYLCVLVNSCLQLLIMTIWACGGCIVELNLNLLILYTNRNRSTQLFKEWRQVTPSHSPQLQNSWWTLNLVLFIYYIYMMVEILQSNDRQFLLFLLLMTNRLFRLYPLHPRVRAKPERFLLKLTVVVALMACDAVVRHYEGREWQVQPEWGSILALPLIIWLYATFYDL